MRGNMILERVWAFGNNFRLIRVFSCREKKNGRHLIIYIRDTHVEVVYLTGVTGVKGEIYLSVISIEMVPDVVSFDNMTQREHIERKKHNGPRAEPCGTSYSGGTADDFSKSIVIIVLHFEFNLIYSNEDETLRKDNGPTRSTRTQFFAAGLVKTGRCAGKSSLFLVSLLRCT